MATTGRVAERVGYRTTRMTGALGRRAGATALMVSRVRSVELDVVERALDLVEGVVLAGPRMSDSSIPMITTPHARSTALADVMTTHPARVRSC